MASVNNRIALQTSRMRFIRTLKDEADNGETEMLNIHAAHAKLLMLNQNWEKFEAEHEKLFSSKTDVTNELDYFKGKAYEETMQFFVIAQAALQQRIADLEASQPFSGSSLANSSLHTPAQIRPPLPSIPLPHFTGKFSEWRHFHDMFVSLVGTNANISNVEKMHYLSNSLQGDAARLVSNLPISGDSFATAWDLLTSRYENKRLLISAHLDKLFSIKRAETRSAKELNTILNTASEATHALKALGSPVHEWDQILVHLLVHRLDVRTREAWEIHLGSSTDFPSYTQLCDFLNGSARALESMESCTSPRKPSSKQASPSSTQSRSSSAHVHLAQQQSTSQPATAQPSHPSGSDSFRSEKSVDPNKTCSYCAKEHFIAFCPNFRLLTPENRLKHAVANRLCYNCLGRHNVYKCRVSLTCKTCQEKHHTMLHGAPFGQILKHASSSPEHQKSAPHDTAVQTD